ncbi:MAG: hypothetical protein LUD29_04210 [Clostridia bacterium]|nr:hypothetical protein [Clostridia bacterium]
MGFSSVSDFVSVVSSCYYVDKSMFIKALIDNDDDVVAMLFTRPCYLPYERSECCQKILIVTFTV